MPAEQINPADDPRKQQAEPEQREEDYGPELDAETILGVDDRPMEKVAVPEWGGHVYVMSISGFDRDQFDRYMARHVDPESQEIVGCNWRAALLARCLCNSQEQLLFSEQQIEQLGNKSGAVLDRLFTVARRLNRMDQRDIDEIKKKFAGGPPGSSQPDSAGTSEAGDTPKSVSES